MCWFFKKKKRKNEEVELAKQNKAQNIPATPTTINPNGPMEPTMQKAYKKDEAPITKETKTIKSEALDLTKDESKKDNKPELKKKLNKSKTETTNTNKKQTPRKETTIKYQGKYEVYPEAGSYKFRLKASNGEILAVSFRYTTEKGALSGIDTFKKNVDGGIFEVYKDKSNYSQFVLYNSSKARVIIIGEFYTNDRLVESAIESVKKFYHTDKIETLKSIPEDEIREELIKFEKVTESSTGKYEIYEEDNSYFARLKANNAQVLFVSTNYASKASCKQGLETIKKAISENRFTVGRDKQKRYQFNLYSSTNQLILTGEIYPQKSSCISAINSARKFAMKAKIVEI